MKKELQKIAESIYYIPYSKDANDDFIDAVKKIKGHIDSGHLLRVKHYSKEIDSIKEMIEDISSFTSNEDKLLHRKIQRAIANLAKTVCEENKKIFIVHGRNISMRDKVASVLGRLKLDYVILESEHNSGATIIEKFLREAGECGFAVVLFSADDFGHLNVPGEKVRPRTRQNVILELGYFLGTVGRKNIVILHETGKQIEKPSDFDGIVYEPFDEYGAWKGKLIKEMKRAGIYIDQALADRV